MKKSIDQSARFAPLVVLVTLATVFLVLTLVAPVASQVREIEAGADSVPGFVEVIREATAPYADIEVARADGWAVAITDCKETEAGGMGYHFGRPALLEDGGQLDPMTPETLMYEPQADGSMELVGVEYILPAADWHGEGTPVFLDQDMVWNEAFGIWTLHVWTARENPEGVFTAWNPTVSCAWAGTEQR